VCQPDDTHPALPGREDPEGLWAGALAHGERDALAAAFATDRGLRGELEPLLRGLEHGPRTVYVREFARALIGPPAPVTSVGAVLVALGATVNHPPVDRP